MTIVETCSTMGSTCTTLTVSVATIVLRVPTIAQAHSVRSTSSSTVGAVSNGTREVISSIVIDREIVDESKELVDWFILFGDTVSHDV